MIQRRDNLRLYRIWQCMKTRCYNKNCTSYKNYGGRGITIDPYWLIFHNFATDMIDGYSNNLTIERIDNNRGYFKENCRWATRREQVNNRRNNIFLTYQGMRKTISEWSSFLNINQSTLWHRYNELKWPIGNCLEEIRLLPIDRSAINH